MDTPFITGAAAFASAIIVFVGSAFLLLTLILGARLAYFITASITLAFTLVMGVVWSINPLGPVGQLPEWDSIDANEDATALDFEAASSYPDEPWAVPNEDDQVELTKASELESGATGFVEQSLIDGEIEGFPSTAQLTVAEDTTRLTTQGENEYGIVVLDVLPPPAPPELGIPPRQERLEEAPPTPEADPLGEIAVVMQYDPGNPLGLARQITVGTFILLVLHLFGLSRAERKARTREAEAPG